MEDILHLGRRSHITQRIFGLELRIEFLHILGFRRGHNILRNNLISGREFFLGHIADSFGCQIRETIFPVLLRIKVCGIPSKVRHAKEGDSGGFCLVHGVGQNTYALGGIGADREVCIDTVCKELRIRIIVYRIVPPDTRLAAGTGGKILTRAVVDRAAHGVTR